MIVEAWLVVQPTPKAYMGLLVQGTPLDWKDSLDYLAYVRAHGIEQFLQIYDRVKDRQGDVLKWGDELEYGIFRVDHDTKTVRLSTRSDEIMQLLIEREKTFRRQGGEAPQQRVYSEGCHWVPEYGSWMIEATPDIPYGGYVSDLTRVETNMRLRRTRLLKVLRSDEIAPTVTCFPLLGQFMGLDTNNVATATLDDDDRKAAQSMYVSDAVINPHPRFRTLTSNIRQRRESKVDIRVPIFQDRFTGQHYLYRKLKTKSSTGSSSSHELASPVKEWKAEQSRSTVDDYQCTRPKKKLFRSAASSSVKENPQDKDHQTTQLMTDRSKDDHDHRATPSPIPGSCPSSSHAPRAPEPYPGFIHMDAMAFGMGMCCLQVTFQAQNLAESRHLYDHLAVLSPIFLALTAATPILKGQLADTDVRWATIAAAVDDRTPAERGLVSRPLGDDDDNVIQRQTEYYSKMAGKGQKRLSKSRYESISLFICNHKDGLDPQSNLDMYNDLDIPIDERAYVTLVERGVDDALAKHIAHLFVRDPLVIFSERIELDDASESDHFENIQSTNWQTVRWKPPPVNVMDGHAIGWRTEFRSMEIQLTDFENAAFTVFLVLVTRVILAFHLNLYIPLSKLDENVELAHRRNGVLTEKFHFRCHLAPPQQQQKVGNDTTCSSNDDASSTRGGGGPADPNGNELMTIYEILMGKGDYYPGLIPLVEAYLDDIQCDKDTRKLLGRYIALIRKRASGELPTIATWMRRFVQNHAAYEHDSIVHAEIAYDLLNECKAIGEGLTSCAELLGEDVVIEPIHIADQNPYEVPLRSTGLEQNRLKLVQRYIKRKDSIT